jgi:ribose transport system substrate-binding protein
MIKHFIGERGSSPRRRVRRGAAALIGAATLAGTVISAAPAGASPSFTAADLAYVKAQITAYEKVPTFTAPGPAFKASKLAGKSIFNIPQSSSNPFLAVTDTAMAAIAKKLGINYTEYSNAGATSDWVSGVDEAVAQKADAISINALDPRLVGPQLAAAKAAGIPVTSEQFFDMDQINQRPKTLSAVRADFFAEAGRLEADWAILSTKGKANVLVVENKEQLSTLAMTGAIAKEFATYCPTCKVEYLNVPATQWATGIQPGVQADLVHYPKTNFIIPIYDPMTQFVVPAITAAGDVGKIHISTFNGTPSGLTDLEQGKIVTMDIGENLNWLAYANLDEIMRTMLHLPALADEHTALRVFTKANVAQTGTPPQFNLGFGSSYIAGYNKLWGVSSS